MKLVAIDRLEKTREIMGLEVSWRELIYRDSHFKVSDYGHIFERSPSACKLYTGIDWWVIEPTLSTRGYLVIGRKDKTYYVHRLVAEAHLGKSSLDVNHKNGNKLDNNVSNLEYCTPKENVTHFNMRLRDRPCMGAYRNNQKSGKMWITRIVFNGIDKYLGSFYTQEEAVITYKEEFKKLYGVYPEIKGDPNA